MYLVCLSIGLFFFRSRLDRVHDLMIEDTILFSVLLIRLSQLSSAGRFDPTWIRQKTGLNSPTINFMLDLDQSSWTRPNGKESVLRFPHLPTW